MSYIIGLFNGFGFNDHKMVYVHLSFLWPDHWSIYLNFSFAIHWLGSEKVRWWYKYQDESSNYTYGMKRNNYVTISWSYNLNNSLVAVDVGAVVAAIRKEKVAAWTEVVSRLP